MQVTIEQGTLSELLEQAVHELSGQGWKIMGRQDEDDASWHLLARKGSRWRVIQLLPPAVTPQERQARRLELGDTIRMPSRSGTMEQWLAHLRPDGHLSFGPYVLNAQRWAGSDQQWWAEGNLSSLGRFAVAASPDR